MLLLIVFLTLSFAWNRISGFPKIAVRILPDLVLCGAPQPGRPKASAS